MREQNSQFRIIAVLLIVLISLSVGLFLFLLHRLRLSTQIPNVTTIGTGKRRCQATL